MTMENIDAYATYKQVFDVSLYTRRKGLKKNKCCLS